MGAVWSDERKFQRWLDVEIAAMEAWVSREPALPAPRGGRGWVGGAQVPGGGGGRARSQGGGGGGGGCPRRGRRRRAGVGAGGCAPHPRDRAAHAPRRAGLHRVGGR